MSCSESLCESSTAGLECQKLLKNKSSVWKVGDSENFYKNDRNYQKFKDFVWGTSAPVVESHTLPGIGEFSTGNLGRSCGVPDATKVMKLSARYPGTALL